jgi:acylphosphatase
MSKTIRQVMIRGRVQGVGYRAWVAHTAAGLGLAGWVRNRRDGSVEAVFAGSLDVVTDMVARCHHGPSMARVDAVLDEAGNADALKLRAPGETFSVLPTV